MPQNTNQELLQRFVDAQDHGYEFGETYAKALDEMKQGQKMTHWIWYVFPQIQGLGKSFIAVYFSIYDLEEAVAYYQHPILGARLREITAVLLEIPSDNPWSVFGQTDARKVRSCMTLFRQAALDDDLFSRVLYKFYRGVEDKRTLEQLHIF